MYQYLRYPTRTRIIEPGIKIIGESAPSFSFFVYLKKHKRWNLAIKLVTNCYSPNSPLNGLWSSIVSMRSSQPWVESIHMAITFYDANVYRSQSHTAA